MFMSKLSS